MDFFIIVFSILLSTVFGYLRQKFNYWEYQGVQQLKTHFLFGNFFKLKTVHHSALLQEVYEAFKGKARIAGSYVFTQPIAVVLDLDLAKSILIKDFNKFVDRNAYTNEKDFVNKNLFQLHGEKWRLMRTKLTPTFTSGKMKFMFPTILGVAKEFEVAFERERAASGDGSVELHDMIGRFTTDVIGTCAFGIDCNSLRDPTAEFREFGRLIFTNRYRWVRWLLFLNTYSSILQHVGLTRTRPFVKDFIMRVVRETVTSREQNNIKRNDFINLLIEMKNTKDENGEPILEFEELAAQVFVFFIAGFETSSSNMSNGLFELAKHPDIQEKLRTEIATVLERHGGQFTYEAMMEMTYLDQVISETLRMYPALAALTRVAMDDYPIPETRITLQKGTEVMIPVKAIHYDPEIYDNPKEFRPERFAPAELQKHHPQAFLGFGDGPRNCIGLRFGRMQVRVGLVTLLQHYRFSLCSKTPTELKTKDHSFILVPRDGVWLRADPL